MNSKPLPSPPCLVPAFLRLGLTALAGPAMVNGIRWAATLFFLVTSVPVVTANPPLAPVDNCSSLLSEPLETVTIDGITYPVPERWIGQKLNTPPLKAPALVRIPQELTENQSTIYIVQEACAALVAMAARAMADGITLLVDSGYRSARYQQKIFINHMEKGRNFNKLSRYMAPPGYSEHMLGTVVDFIPGDWRFADTPAHAWLLEHAGEFGFYESYPENDPHHPWEPWHWRYRKPGK